MRFSGGARGVLETSRVSVGDQCTYGIEVHGDRGALAWDFRRMGELRVLESGEGPDPGYVDGSLATEFVGVGAGELVRFQPGAGIAMGYDDLKVIEAHRLITSIVTGRPVGATIHDAVVAAELVEAMVTSAAEGGWVSLTE